MTLQSQVLKDEWVNCNSQGCKLLDPYYSEGVTFKWEGPCVNGKADGNGICYKYVNGELQSKYEGDYKNGIREGLGKFFVDGQTYKGHFVNGQLMGFGTWTTEDGMYYEGEFVNYRAHGRGIQKFANGSKFEGFFVSDRGYDGVFTKYDGEVYTVEKSYKVDKPSYKNMEEYKPILGQRVTEYFDENWKRCNQRDAAYYRLISYESENKPKGKIRDFYITGQLQSEYTAIYLDYYDEGKNFHEGEAVWYYKNGKVEQKRSYRNNILIGKNLFYYENGQLEKEVNYKNGYYDGNYIQWYQNGKLKLTAKYEYNTLKGNTFVEYDENGLSAEVYDEMFRLKKENWTISESGHSSSVNEFNQLEFKNNETTTVSRFNYIPLEQSDNYSIESTIKKEFNKAKEGYGLLFGFKDWGNYHQFIISDAGYFRITGYFENVAIEIKDWTQSALINIEGIHRNQLKILKLDDEFIFSINGHIVHRSKSYSLRGNNFGIISHGKGNFVLENIRIKHFNPKGSSSRDDISEDKSDEEWKGNGSGFFINERGYIATNYHVVEDAAKIEVEYFQKGVKYNYNAKVIVTDKQNDLAIIKIQDARFTTIPKIPYFFANTTKDVGSDVFALGYPMADVMGSEIKFTDGKISSKTGIGGDVRVYQVSVPIQPGNSGGPLFDNKGGLIGVTSSGLNKEYFNSENVNYAIKINYLKNLIEVLPENIQLPNDYEISNKPLIDKIKLLSDFVPLIRVK